MRTHVKFGAAATIAAVMWLGQPVLRAASGCYIGYPVYTNYFPNCGGYCDGYMEAELWECNNMGQSAMASDCYNWCVNLDYPEYSGGILHSYYSNSETGDDSGSCQCYF